MANKILSILLILCTLASLDAKAQSDDHNYIAKSSMQDEQGKNSVVTVEYYDGLGRKEQVVSNGVTPENLSKDLLTPSTMTEATNGKNPVSTYYKIGLSDQYLLQA